MITIFKDFNETKTPHYLPIEKVLQRIKDCKIQSKIDELRNEPNEKRRGELKKMLPCICFSGKLKTRKDADLFEHSGYIVLDFDKLDNAEDFKIALKRHHFVYSAFISPSGNGVKAIAKIPPIIEKHRGYYRGILKVFPELDSTSINESRICFESIDPTLWINEAATEFTDYIEEEKKKPKEPYKKQKLRTDYSKVNISLEMIRNSIDGGKHATLLKAAKLMGGYIATGYVDEYEALRLLEDEIQNKGVDNIAQARQTIADGIEYGKTEPIIDQPIKQTKIKSTINVNDDDYSFLASDDDVNEYLDQWRKGTFQKGLSTGLESFDRFFLFKRGNFNVYNGFDNVGKSTTLWYFCLLSSLYHGWRWIIYSAENRNGSVIKRLIEFYCGERIHLLKQSQYDQAYNFIRSKFTIINNEQMYNFKDVLTITEKLQSKSKYDGLLLDPYNALKIDLADNSKLSTHEYHYEAASEMQMFAKKNDICVYLNCHVITGAMRLKTPPMKADTEGGGKFANKADDFVTIHRETQDPQNWMCTQLHVRKIKEIETGGGYTPIDEPYILKMNVNSCGFSDLNGFDPVVRYKNLNNKQIEARIEIEVMQPNQSFLTGNDIITNNNEDPF
jgi:hypothetical protein